MDIEPLESLHDRGAFSCGKESLDRYLRQQATQDIRRGVANVFVAVAPQERGRILGFFTLSAVSVVPTELPADIAKRLPRYPIPAGLIGRLAVDRSVARRGLGGILLSDAIQKAMTAAEIVAMSAIVVDPIDDEARAFYSAFGFRSLEGPQHRMFLTLSRSAK
ncbi:MAG: GNAT family N-acetyltransferase [Proteobacteria bacterium]|nr:GNAT family N-acetyltransferase [Pseudomonadota bacterium]